MVSRLLFDARQIRSWTAALRYDRYDPGLFRPGDIVEIAFSCIGIPIKEKRHKMLLNLRALTLLDDSIRKVKGNCYCGDEC